MRIEQENRRTAERAPQGGGRVRSAAVKEPFAGNGRPTRVPGRAGATAAARSRGRTGGAAVRGRVPAGGAA
ncbi:MAG: hypothetical protein QM207_06515, partial [Thermobispora sp.]|nr:hypothetical protein [Thermobispora sp.]